MTPVTLSPADGDCLVVMYHYVRDAAGSRFPGLKALAPADFEAQLDWLARDWHPVTFPQFEAAMRGDAPLPARAALLTFDDGFVDHYETVFPSLRARGWSGVFFLAGATLDDEPRLLNVHKTQFLLAVLGAGRFSSAVDAAIETAMPEAGNRRLAHRAEVYRYDASPDLAAKHLLNYELPFAVSDHVLSDLFAAHLGDETAFARGLYVAPEMVREMAAGGMTFGFHTERHPVLSRLDGVVQRAELHGGAARVRALTGQESVPFCYPYGHPHTYDVHTLAALDEGGYAAAFNTVRRLARPAADPRFEIPRFDTRDLPPFVKVEIHA